MLKTGKCKKKKSLKNSHKSRFWHFRKTAKKEHNKEYVYIYISTHKFYIYIYTLIYISHIYIISQKVPGSLFLEAFKHWSRNYLVEIRRSTCIRWWVQLQQWLPKTGFRIDCLLITRRGHFCKFSFRSISVCQNLFKKQHKWFLRCSQVWECID